MALSLPSPTYFSAYYFYTWQEIDSAMSFLKQNRTGRPQAPKSGVALTDPTFCLFWVNDLRGVRYSGTGAQVLTNARGPDRREKSITLQLLTVCGCLLPVLLL